MESIGSLIRRHAVLLYYTLTFAISWGAILLVVGLDGIPGTPDEFQRLFPVALAGLLGGPSIAGILMTGLAHGRAGLLGLLSRLLNWRVGLRWYLVALLAGPLLMLAIPLLLSLASAEFIPRVFSSGNGSSLVALGISAGLMGGFLEELGWTGFAIPELRQRHSVLATGLIVGLLWGTWHILMNVWSSGDSSGALAAILFLHSFIFSVGILPAYRILMVWVYDHTASLLVATLMHTGLIVGNVLFVPQAIEQAPGPIWSLVVALALWLAVALVARTGRLGALRPKVAPAA